ncbi:MAG: hypothetical protein OEZ32_00065 [Nitrospinota bacterium]|nr:hypothetical protein [Nitrospinota bacterium]
MTINAWVLAALSGIAALAAAMVVLLKPFPAVPGFEPAGVKPLLGWAALALGLISMVFSIRKRQSLQWPGELSIWRTVHVVVGLLFVVSLLLHSGGKLGAGVAFWLVALTTAIFLTGLWGIVSQGWIPAKMTQSLQDPVYKDKMQDDINLIMQQISNDLEGRSERFEQVYQRHILPAISLTRPWMAQQRAFFNRYDPTSDDVNAAYRDLGSLSLHEKEIFYTMAEKALDIIEIRRSQGFQALLNNWLDWHIAVASIIMAMAFMHVMASYVF